MYNLKTRFVWSLNTTTTLLNPEEIIAAWQSHKVLYIHISDLDPETVQPYYDQLLPKIGTPYALAEDVTFGDRSQPLAETHFNRDSLSQQWVQTLEKLI
ncbi:hypothetical protein [Cylindrospermopsis raciborskii]|uniref:hypothetical protein n=1 Tax=Cylindrospermopsis raciborskii TaxID=77022 RepID=UPI000C9E9C69|nr:hypothetical protein [Cylindrospermopsis raciborskii]PNK21416.1 hypothetical protein CEP07_01785 [Cylindrospermopsis raciborskii S01]